MRQFKGCGPLALFAGILLAGSSIIAKADTLYSTFAPAPTTTNNFLAIQGAFSWATEFSLSSAGLANQINVVIASENGSTDFVTVALYEDGPSGPGNELAFGVVSTSSSASSIETATLSSVVALDANTNYWVGLLPTTTTTDVYANVNPTVGATDAVSPDDGAPGTWQILGASYYPAEFQILSPTQSGLGATPLPKSGKAGVALLGLLGIGGLLRRKALA